MRPRYRRQPVLEQHSPPTTDELELVLEPAGEVELVLEQLADTVSRRRNLELVERALVAVARHRGATWAQVGEALKVSRQAAQKRYGDGPAS